MTDKMPITPPRYPPPKVLDAVFLKDTYEELGQALWRAKHEVSYFRREICSLVTEPALPEAFRGAYGRVVSVLEAVERAIIAGENECFVLRDEALSAGLLDWVRPVVNVLLTIEDSCELSRNNAQETPSWMRGLRNARETGSRSRLKSI